MADNNSIPTFWVVLLAVMGPVAAGLILDYIRERRHQRRMLETE